MKEPIENWDVYHKHTVEYGCSNCDKMLSKPKFAIIKRVGKDKYRVLEVYCSNKCRKEDKLNE